MGLINVKRSKTKLEKIDNSSSKRTYTTEEGIAMTHMLSVRGQPCSGSARDTYVEAAIARLGTVGVVLKGGILPGDRLNQNSRGGRNRVQDNSTGDCGGPCPGQRQFLRH
jgi:hypothetical protein